MTKTTLSIATWNVNSISARLPTALAVLKDMDADIVCLQEIKCEDAKFPRMEIEDLGYHVEVFGQKTYNGVALLSRHRIEDAIRGLPNFEHDQARYLEAVIAAPMGPVRVACVYAPNGNPPDTEKYTLKANFTEALIAHAAQLLLLEEVTAIAGDYNIIPREEDCWDKRAWEGDALFLPQSRAYYRRLIHQGWTDAFMQADGRAHQYTFWDYQGGAWAKDHGIRIDHIMLSPQAADRLEQIEIKRAARGREKPSDHTPVVAFLA